MQDKFLALPSAASYYALSAENRRNSIELDEFSFFFRIFMLMERSVPKNLVDNLGAN